MHHRNLTPPKGNLWFVADTHFGHAGSIQHTKRPFASVAEMDALLIEAWNAVIRGGDTVVHLGDFEWGHTPARTAEIFASLKGKKHLVVGNHDRKRVTDLPWESVQERLTVHADRKRIICDHYPLRAWPGSFNGSIHLHGHTYGSLPGTSRSCDVGVDVWGYRPVGLDAILERMAATVERPEEVERAAAREADEADDA